MKIHEYQGKELFKKHQIKIPVGFPAFSIEEALKAYDSLDSDIVAIKAQIHAGGRGKAGGVKLAKNSDEAIKLAKEMFGKILKTHQTGSKGKRVRSVYIEEASDISKEYYLSCLIDRSTSKIAFISSTQGGVDIEKVAKENPEKIITNKLDLEKEIDDQMVNTILRPFNFNESQSKDGRKLIHSLYKILVEKDATLIEINPLVITKEKKLICLDAKMNFDDNALFRRPEILKLRDLSQEEPAEIEAGKYNLAYIKLDGSIGCMVNGAGLAMATMDIIKLYGQEPANFLDVGGGATKEQVAAAFRLILSDKKVKGILINIFGGIMRCDVLAQGLIDTAKETNLKVPLVVRLAGTNFQEGKKILDESNLKILSALDLNDAAKKIVNAIK